MGTEDSSNSPGGQDPPAPTIKQSADGTLDISALLSAMGLGAIHSSNVHPDGGPGALQIPVVGDIPVTLQISPSGGMPVTLQIPGMEDIPVTLALSSAAPGDESGTIHAVSPGTTAAPGLMPGASPVVGTTPEASYSEGNEVTGGYGTADTMDDPV